MRRILTAAIVASLAIPLSACTQLASVRVQPGSTQQHLTFLLSEEGKPDKPLRSFGGMSVRPYVCGQSEATSKAPVWVLTAKDGVGLRPAPRAVRYGETPPGFVSERGPAALSVGCYEAALLTAGYSGSVRFEILPTGAVREVTTGVS